MWLVFAVTASVLWGLNYVFSEKALSRISPFTLMALEFALGLVFALVAGMLSQRLVPDLARIGGDRRLLLLVAAAVTTMTVGYTMITLSVAAKNATLAGLIEISYPIFIALFAWLLFRESHINAGIAAGGVLIFTGVAVVYVYS